MAKTPVDFEEAIQAFDRSAAQKDGVAAESERQEIVTRFPIGDWAQLPLSRYALGQGNKQDTFCWWLEFGTPHIGSIRGSPARKHIVFKHNDGTWHFDRKRFKDENEAWLALRAVFVNAFAKAQNDDWAAVESDDFGWGPGPGVKALYCYFPDRLLPVFSIVHIVHFLKLLGDQDATISGYEVVRHNRRLQKLLHSRLELEGWSNDELVRLLYAWADPRDQRKMVKIAPGEEAKYWEQCRDSGYICVGWDGVGDLELFDSKEAFRRKFDEVYGETYKNNRGQLTRKSNEVWTLQELDIGDLVVANKGLSKVLAVGEVVEPGYEWNESRNDYRHTVRVKWDLSFEQDIPSQGSWQFTTVKAVPHDLATRILKKAGAPPVVVPTEPIHIEMANALARKGQAILYGPPGTGKTYTARRFAVWWLLKEQKSERLSALGTPESYREAEEKLSTAQIARRAWWIVANPKDWSWDRLSKDGRVTFGMGRLRRNYPLVRRGDFVIGYQSTPDKKIVALAKVSRELVASSDGEPCIELEPVTTFKNGLTLDEVRENAVLRDSEPMRFRNLGTLFTLTENEFEHLAALLTEREPELRKHLEAQSVVGPLTWLTFHASYSYEDFIEGYRPTDSGSPTLTLKMEDGVFKRVCREAQANPKKLYLVLIDEINRANVAKVFGEVITLLEKDKRSLTISLPQSKEAFAVPPNVFIVGTMNTADRSIKLLDAALRRRFAFIEVMPDSSLLEGSRIGNLDLGAFLDELNRRIAAKEGREKQIGHSFLMDAAGRPVSEPEEFARRFRQEILPLLQEYCYEEYGTLADYIGEELVDKDAESLNNEILNDPSQLIAALENAFAGEVES